MVPQGKQEDSGQPAHHAANCVFSWDGATAKDGNHKIPGKAAAVFFFKCSHVLYQGCQTTGPWAR